MQTLLLLLLLLLLMMLVVVLIIAPAAMVTITSLARFDGEGRQDKGTLRRKLRKSGATFRRPAWVPGSYNQTKIGIESSYKANPKPWTNPRALNL